MVSKNQFLTGIINYIDSEVMPCLPTSGKWALGTIVTLGSDRLSIIFDEYASNPMVKALGIVSVDMVDTDKLITALRCNAEKYGKLEVSIPLVGNLKFSATDIDKLRNYIGGVAVG